MIYRYNMTAHYKSHFIDKIQRRIRTKPNESSSAAVKMEI